MLMSTRKNRQIYKNEYYEKHHIMMRSMGGDNSPDNIVYLTAREHYLAHWLLWRIYRNKEAAFAFKMMNVRRNNQEKYFSSRGYEESKIAAISLLKGKSPMQGRKLSDDHKKKIGESGNITRAKKKENGTNWVMNDEQRRKLSQSHKGKKSKGFYKSWVEKFGKEEADRMKKDMYTRRKKTPVRKKWSDETRKKMLSSFKNRKTFYQSWVEKFGKEEADKMKTEFFARRKKPHAVDL